MKERAKNAFKHDIEVAGKRVPVLAVAALFVIGAGSAAVLTAFGTVSGTAQVDQAVTLDTKDNVQKSLTYNFDGQQTAGETEVETHTLHNNADVATTVDFSTTCKKGGTKDTSTGTSNAESIDWTGECKGIDTDYVEYFDDAGHDFSDYTVPEESEADVEYISNPANIDTSSTTYVLEDSGTPYSGLTVGKSLNDVDVYAETRGVEINGKVDLFADNVGLYGFDITNSGGEVVDIDKNVNTAEVAYNVINGAGSSQGVAIWTDGTFTVKNNLIQDVRGGVHTSPGVTDLTVKDNTIEKFAYGVQLQADSSKVERNAIRSSQPSNWDRDWSVGSLVRTDNNPDATSTFVSNNFENIRDEDISHILGGGPTVTATDNWFGTDGIQTYGDVNADWQTKTDLTVEVGTSDEFGAVNDFAINLVPDSYSLTTEIVPVTN